MQLLEAFNIKMNKILCVAMYAGFFAMLSVAFLHILLRYTMQPMPIWTEPMARHLFIFSTYLGASIVFYEGKQINISFFVDLFTNTRIKAFFLLFADFACLLFTAVFTWQGFILSASVPEFEVLITSLPRLRLGYIYAAIPICCLCMFLNILVYTLRHLFALITGKDVARAIPYEI